MAGDKTKILLIGGGVFIFCLIVMSCVVLLIFLNQEEDETTTTTTTKSTSTSTSTTTTVSGGGGGTTTTAAPGGGTTTTIAQKVIGRLSTPTFTLVGNLARDGLNTTFRLNDSVNMNTNDTLNISIKTQPTQGNPSTTFVSGLTINPSTWRWTPSGTGTTTITNLNPGNYRLVLSMNGIESNGGEFFLATPAEPTTTIPGSRPFNIGNNSYMLYNVSNTPVSEIPSITSLANNELLITSGLNFQFNHAKLFLFNNNAEQAAVIVQHLQTQTGTTSSVFGNMTVYGYKVRVLDPQGNPVVSVPTNITFRLTERIWYMTPGTYA